MHKEKLKDVAEITMGTSPSGDTYNEDEHGLPLLNGPTEFGQMSPNCTLFTTDSKRECKSGDLIFCVRGSTTGRMNWADKVYSLGRGVCSIRGNSKLETKYIKYALDYSLRSLLKLAGGGTFPNLTKTTIHNFEILYPDSRFGIASILSAFDDLIKNNSRRIEILEEMARWIYREWFVHFRYPGHENDELVDSGTELGEIPEGWEVKKLEDFGEIVLGKTPSTKDSANYGDYMPFIKTPDMHDQYFIHETENVLSKKGVETQQKKTLPVDTICVSCIGTAGVVAITSVPSQTNQQINSIVPEDIALREYLYFTTKSLKPLMEKIGSTGATMTNVSKTKFKGLPALSAPENVINNFHAKVSPLFDQISILQKQNNKLKETRDLLLPKLISGDIENKRELSHASKENR